MVKKFPGSENTQLAPSGKKIYPALPSLPDGAEIFVDSSGYGKSPSIVKLPAGNHAVQVVMSGYKDWMSTVLVNSDTVVSVKANLEK